MAVFVFLCLVLIGKITGLEPGKSKQDFETIEEINPQSDSTPMEEELEDESWIPEAVLDVAYYLRKHKNNGYDPRYLTENGIPRKNLYAKFPTPPLRTLHWEVKKNCDTSFAACLKYLQEKVVQTALPRHLDSLTVIKHNGWKMDKDKDLIKATDEACIELRERDEKTFNAFQGPLQKFQWLTTASYYMCWYTMKEVRHLKTFQDDCDNFANCLDWSTGPSNGDIRARNDRPFACAMYSFCPDPCCPERYILFRESCTRVNPCSRHHPQDDRCIMNRSSNSNFESLTLNHWNVTCNCDHDGLIWESRSGMCVDMDECTENVCPEPSQSCMNLPGSYSCVCNMMGYENDVEGNCVVDSVVQKIIYPPKIIHQEKNKTVADTFFDFVYHIKSILFMPDERDETVDGNSTNSRRT